MSNCRSDLGADINFEAIGLIDSKLETFSRFINPKGKGNPVSVVIKWSIKMSSSNVSRLLSLLTAYVGKSEIFKLVTWKDKNNILESWKLTLGVCLKP